MIMERSTENRCEFSVLFLISDAKCDEIGTDVMMPQNGPRNDDDDDDDRPVDCCSCIQSLSVKSTMSLSSCYVLKDRRCCGVASTISST